MLDYNIRSNMNIGTMDFIIMMTSPSILVVLCARPLSTVIVFRRAVFSQGFLKYHIPCKVKKVDQAAPELRIVT